MRKGLKILFSFCFASIATILVISYFMISLPNVYKASEKELSTIELSNKSLIDKSIRVNGSVVEKLIENDYYAIILDVKAGKNVLCQFTKFNAHNFEEIEIHQCVEIRGIYKGELSEHILLNCTIEFKESNDKTPIFINLTDK